jgi:hypothetical protein
MSSENNGKRQGWKDVLSHNFALSEIFEGKSSVDISPNCTYLKRRIPHFNRYLCIRPADDKTQIAQ